MENVCREQNKRSLAKVAGACIRLDLMSSLIYFGVYNCQMNQLNELKSS